MEHPILKEAHIMESELIRWRRNLHAMPEVGLHLPGTAAFIQQELAAMGISCQVYPEISCVSAVIGSGKTCLLLRADMDALAVKEETALPFRAKNGCMHGCGHDLHAAMLLGAAKLLKSREKELGGRVKLLFQSGEEPLQGAKAAIAAGLLENPKVDAAFAMHVVAMLPMGTAFTGKAPTASADLFRITVTGQGGHGSMPERCIDPVGAAVQVYLALQSLIAREVGGTEEAVLTVGQLTAGETANVIPQQAILQGSLRTFQKELRSRLLRRMEEISIATAAAYRCQCRVEIPNSCCSLVTDEALTALGKSSITSLCPHFHVDTTAHGMGSDDFAEIADRVPVSYYMLGAGPADESKRRSQHHPEIEFNEEILPLGAAIFTKVATDFLAQK